MTLPDRLTLGRFEEAWRRVAARQQPQPSAPPLPLSALRQRVLSGAYRPGPLTRREKRKPDGRVRVLGIPSLVDRVTQLAVLFAAGPRLDGLLSARVHGYRPGRSPRTAIAQLTREARGPHLEIVQADLQEMFDRLPHEATQRAAAWAWDDPLWRHLVDAWLRAWPSAPERGLPQGAPLSPMLANLTLARVLDSALEQSCACGWAAPVAPAARLAAARRALRASLFGASPSLPAAPRLRTWMRYGDDLVLVSDAQGGGVGALRWLDGLARAASLTLSDAKTVTAVARHGQPLPRPVLGVPLRAVRAGGAWQLTTSTLPVLRRL